MWPRTRTLLSIMVLGAIVGGLVQWQLLRMQDAPATEPTVDQIARMEAEVKSGSVVIGKTDDGWYAPLLRRAAERQFVRQQQPCVTGVCQDI